VIKSLDHWPDLGSDLDLYTNANFGRRIELMKRRFDAQIAPRSWGDRLAANGIFLSRITRGRRDSHGAPGANWRTGSQLPRVSGTLAAGDDRQLQAFRVPSASDRLMISTLQRMYRHFYFRLCDIVDTAALSERGIDYWICALRRRMPAFGKELQLIS
jgi:hypothetical protein